MFDGEAVTFLGEYKNTPVGKAIRASIIEIDYYLKCSFVERKTAAVGINTQLLHRP
jgi:hypothetical protein